MAAIISESYQSRAFTVGGQSVRERIYDITGTEDEEEVRDALVTTAPGVYLSLKLDSVNADPLGGGVWKGYARYAKFEDGSEYTFSTSGGTQKVTQSIFTVSSYAPAGMTAPDFQGAIGVSADRVEGVDITTPIWQFSETHEFTDAQITPAYKRILFGLTGRWNDAAFKGLASGECLFLGATGSRRGGEFWSITFLFAGSENVVDQTIGGTGEGYYGYGYDENAITGIDKLGWDYLWVRYAEFEDTFSSSLVQRPVGCYVERVYHPGNFALLAIGTT